MRRYRSHNGHSVFGTLLVQSKQALADNTLRRRQEIIATVIATHPEFTADDVARVLDTKYEYTLPAINIPARTIVVEPIDITAVEDVDGVIMHVLAVLKGGGPLSGGSM